MPGFAKNPKFIAVTVFILWLVYVIYANFKRKPNAFSQTLDLWVFPFVALTVNVFALIIAAIVFGVIATLVIQFLWKRRSSKNGKQAMVA